MPDYNFLRGKFISLESGEGGGKGKQIELLKKYLVAQGLDVLLTREPGGTPIAEDIRTILKHEDNRAMSTHTELFLFQGARVEILKDVIVPAMKEGKVVLSDRFSDATKVYQGHAGKIPQKIVDAMVNMAITHEGRRIVPDLTFLLDIDTESGLSRANRRDSAIAATDTRFEQKGLDFHRRVREGCLLLAKKEPLRFRVIDAMGSPEEVHSRIRESLDDYLMNPRPLSKYLLQSFYRICP